MDATVAQEEEGGLRMKQTGAALHMTVVTGLQRNKAASPYCADTNGHVRTILWYVIQF
ncbi:hypothetical protein JRQ81_019798 [Phrynocephalus forsythii]|uniref:Uncharacterized protein n=1 Tax=Phrynocephalus forsythii TaxID=171643 RepID=A0A9Q1AYV3_9SAUR|nr:hypothetical protein JRQ81_019798 [Phrynocephalus forsythii]